MTTEHPTGAHFHSGTDASGPDGALGGDVAFFAGNGGEEILRFTPSGEFIYRGKLVETDRELYDTFVSWLGKATPELGKGEKDGGDAEIIPEGA